MNEPQLIHDCINNNPRAQKALYDMLANRMFRLCFRYIGSQYDAEDVMVTAFTKVFRSLSGFEYRGAGSLEKWIKTIMINESLMFLRKSRKIDIMATDEIQRYDTPSAENSDIDAEAIFQLVTQLPDGYRTIFNLYAIDGLSHEEIADKLKISVGTSKSQLSRARALLKEQIVKMEYHGR